MGADIKSLRTRIKSVDSTLHLTKAMGLVASSKMRRSGDPCGILAHRLQRMSAQSVYAGA